MAAKRSRSRGGRRFVATVHKSHGVIQPRVQRVGPEHFDIVSVDCAKARFKWMLCDFYGKVLIPPTTVEHNPAIYHDILEFSARVLAICSLVYGPKLFETCACPTKLTGRPLIGFS
jgi:hypothetical protein